MSDPVQFINNLSGTPAAGLAHTHSHEGHTHSHGPNEHGHTHDVLDHPGTWCPRWSDRAQRRKLDYVRLTGLCFFVSGRFAERDMPDYASRNFEERGFTVGIGGCVTSGRPPSDARRP